MLDYEANRETIERVREIDEKIHNGDVSGKEMTRMMFEQLLRGLYLQ